MFQDSQAYCNHSEYVQLACDFVNKNFDKFLLHAKMSGNYILCYIVILF